MVIRNHTLTLNTESISGRIKEFYLLIFSFILFIYLNSAYNLTLQESFVISYQGYLLLRFVNNIGYTICYFDFLCFYSALDTLVMPIIGYKVYNQENTLARIWGWYMRVSEDDYYAFLIPANLALFAGLNLLIRYRTNEFKQMFNALVENLKGKGKVGIVLTIVGFLGTFFENIQSSLTFVFHLLSMMKYVGPLYIYLSDSPLRKTALTTSLVAFVAQAIAMGMFGEFVMYVVVTYIVLSLKYNYKFSKKLLAFLIGIFLILILQSIKGSYRAITWRGKSVHGLSIQNSSKAEIFTTLFINKLFHPENLFDERTGFFIYTRMNQGYLISRAMDYVPRIEPYAEGETIGRSIAAIIVPRFLWPDKPEAGGHENLSRFLGIKVRLSYSMNIGPYGEAYGNFGPQYGVVFIFGYALFFSLLLKLFLDNCVKRPTLLLWGPLLFYYTLTVETDILTTLNSFIKGAVFVAIVFWISKKFFKTSL